MDNIREDYMKFNVEEESASTTLMSSVIKILVILLLLLAVVVLGALAYKFLFKDDSKQVAPKVIQKQELTTQNREVEQKVANVAKDSNIKIRQEEIAAITKAVLAQIKQSIPQQPQQVAVKSVEPAPSKPNQVENSVPNPTEVDDATLFNDLQTSEVDTTQNEDLDISALDDLTTKKVAKSKKPKKAQDTFNKVVIDKNNVATKDDLAKLYAKLNSIMQKDQAKAKKSDYTKMISKETKVRANEMRIIVVRRGDTLSKIAKRAYGNAMMYNKIYEANPDIIKNPNLIHIGQRLRVPK